MAAVVVASALMVPGASAGTRSGTYVASGGATGTAVCGTSVGVGAVCFTLSGGESSVDISIRDLAGIRVAGEWRFEDSSSNHLKSGTFCGSTSSVSVPDGAAFLVVFAGDAFRPTRCSTPNTGTAGTVQASF